MNSEKQRVISFMLLTFASIMAINLALKSAGLLPDEVEPVAQPPAAKAKAEDQAQAKLAANPPAAAKGEVEKGKAAGEAPATKDGGESVTEAPKSKIGLAKPEELRLGSTQAGKKLVDKDRAGYHLEVQLEQKGAAVHAVASALYEAEYHETKPKGRPLEILQADPKAIPSLAMTIRPPAALAPKVTTGDEERDEAKALAEAASRKAEIPLDGELWEVVRDDQGRAVRTVQRTDEQTKAQVEGQEVRFRYQVEELGLTVIKTYRLFQGSDAFEVALEFQGGEKTPAFGYRLMGPHGIPIEGEWYTGTFRDAVFAQVVGGRVDAPKTLSAYDIAKAGKDVQTFESAPIAYAGIENQYFTSFIEPYPQPKTEAERYEAETRPLVLHDDPEARQKADIGVEILSRPITAGLNAPVTHTYRLYAGPKTYDALSPYGAQDLASYRKSNFIPGASFFATNLITPLLHWTYEATVYVARIFGGRQGNYGVAIILLTLVVRLAMFPLGRKAAMAAKKMQDLQPHLKEIQEKYKDDKEAVTRETFALYRKHGVNPVGGCLPALVQLPVFVGLWQALNNSVNLRHARFLYIDNLAAPDMLFKFPFELPFLGEYFNVLPFLVVALMLVQTKLFAPPATTPEAEMQQKMMKYMMVFMAFMFYKVPSGLGLYFITSSLWQIGERLLLPKVTSSVVTTTGEDVGDQKPVGGDPGSKANGPVKPEKPPGALSQLWKRVLDEAAKDSTYRKLSEERDAGRPGERDRDKDRDRGDRDRGKPRARPGKRR